MPSFIAFSSTFGEPVSKRSASSSPVSTSGDSPSSGALSARRISMNWSAEPPCSPINRLIAFRL